MKRECICKHLFYIRLLFQSKVSHRYQNHSELKIIFLILFPLFLLFLLFLFVFCIFYLLFFSFCFFFCNKSLQARATEEAKTQLKMKHAEKYSCLLGCFGENTKYIQLNWKIGGELRQNGMSNRRKQEQNREK